MGVSLCKATVDDLKVALLEQVIEGLDQNDQTQAEAGAMLQAVIDAFPNGGWRMLCPLKSSPMLSDAG